MSHKVPGILIAVLLTLLVFSAGCSPAAAGPQTQTYNRIFIDTYDPIDPTGQNGASISNYMELWSSDGKTLLASYDGVNNFRSVNAYFAFIDYTGGLTSGDYWVLIKESGGGADAIDYGIRVLLSPPTSYTASTYDGWTFSGPASETISDQPQTGGAGIPSSYKTIIFSNSTGDKYNRHIVSGGVNWMKITLP